MQYLDRSRPAEDGVGAEVHRAHAALADLTDDVVAAYRLSDDRVRRHAAGQLANVAHACGAVDAGVARSLDQEVEPGHESTSPGTSTTRACTGSSRRLKRACSSA